MTPVQNSPPPETINEDEILVVRSETKLQPRRSTSSAVLGSSLVQRSKSINSYHSIAICQDHPTDQKENICTPSIRRNRSHNLNYSVTSSDSESALNKKLSLVISNSDLENTECLTYEMVQRRLKRNRRQRIPSHCEVVSLKSVGSQSGSNLNDFLSFGVGSTLSKLSLSDKQHSSIITQKSTKFSFPEPNKSSNLPQVSTSRTSPNSVRSISPAQYLARSRENLNQSLNFHHHQNTLKNCINNQNSSKLPAPLLEQSISFSEVSDTGSGCLADISTNDISVFNITENSNGNSDNLMVNRIYSNSNFIIQRPTPVMANAAQNGDLIGQNPSRNGLRDSGLNSEISGAFSCGNANNGSPRVFSIGGIKKDRCVSPLIANETNVKVVHNKIRPPSSKNFISGCPELAESITVQTKTQVITQNHQKRRSSIHHIENNAEKKVSNNESSKDDQTKI